MEKLRGDFSELLAAKRRAASLLATRSDRCSSRLRERACSK